MQTIHRFFSILVLSMTVLFASGGTSQEHLMAITPSPDATDVKPNVIFTFTFDRAIIEKLIETDTVQLKQIEPAKKKIEGKVSIEANNTLTFLPSQPLEKGNYSVKVEPIKLQTEEQVAVKPQTKWQEFIAWLCGWVYDDIADCPLCQYVCEVPKNTATKPISYAFEITEDAPKVISLESNAILIELSEYNSTQLSITATYDDNSSEDITQKATYSSSDSSVDADKGVIATNKEGSATVAVSYGNKTIEVQVEVYEMIEGHLLPHEPENPDDTLLGVDKNSNGVRDEVERWIYKEMPTYHHPEIERVIAMQSAKANQMALHDPTNKDDEVHKAIERTADCWSYYSYSKQIPFDGAIEKFNAFLDDKCFNTKERLKTYLDYDYTLKGRVFTSTPLRLLDTSYCDQNIDVMP